MMEIESKRIVEAALKYEGVRFHHQGRNRAGLDCIGLIVAVGVDLGLEHLTEAPKSYPQNFVEKTFLEEMPRYLIEVPTTEMRPGDILLMAFGGIPQHTGIYLGDLGKGYPEVIHCYQKVNGVVKHRFADVWRKRVMKVYRYGIN